MATNLEIIVGTYEQFLLGYKVEQVIRQLLSGLDHFHNRIPFLIG